MGASLLDLVRPGRSPGWVGAAVLCSECGVEPVGRPLPDVAGHVVEAVAVGLERVHRTGAVVTVAPRVLVREPSLSDVHAMLAARLELITPRKSRPAQPATRGELPLGLGRESLAGPRAIV